MGRKLLLLLASAALSLGVAEMVLRFAFPYVGWRQFEDVGLGWSSAEYQRFDPLATPPREGVKRMLFLGDSFIAGAGVTGLDKRFPVLLGERLGEGWEVAILASAGWGTDQELLAYVQKGMAWQPDVVILVFCANNDLANNLSNGDWRGSRKPYFVLADDGQLQLFDSGGVPLDLAAERAQRPVLLQSYLFDLLRFQFLAVPPAERTADSPIQATVQPESVDPRYLRFDAPSEKPSELWKGTKLSWSPEEGVNHVSAYIQESFETNTYQWELFQGILGQLEQATRASGAELVVMLLPVTFRPLDLRFVVGSAYEQYYETPSGGFTFRAAEPRDRVRQAAESVGVGFYDPSGQFLGQIQARGLRGAAWSDPGDRHFSDVAHSLLAELMEQDVKTGLVQLP
ncbi:SGNH/GDSL hydrolase family protein [Myxococcota bacterium]|nr:SGNH/GDSL hydrolase family protein [Myxococcota bacterium]